MDDDSNDIFGLVQYSNDDDESVSPNLVSDSESTSGFTTTTRQSNAITEFTDMKETKSINPESVITEQDQEEFVEKNTILLQLQVSHKVDSDIRKEASTSLSPMEYTRKKCLLSSRLHPVKVESVRKGIELRLQIISQCAKKMGMNYKPQRKDAIAIAGMAKLYVRDLVMKGVA